MTDGETTRSLLQKVGGVVLMVLVFPLGLCLGGVGVWMLIHMGHNHPTQLPVWVPITLLVLGIMPFLAYFRVQFFGVLASGAKLAADNMPKLSFGKKKEGE